MLREIVASLLLAGGSLVLFVSSVGILRLPDAYSRSHAMAKGMSLAVCLLLLGLGVYLDNDDASFRILLAIAFQLVLIPTAGHLIGFLAAHLNTPRWNAQRVERPRIRRNGDRNEGVR